MIVESFSPFVRRLLAIGLLLLALLVAFQLIVAPIMGMIEDGRRELTDTRFRLERLDHLLEAPPPPAPPAVLQTQLLHAPDRDAAEARLLALLRDLAGRQGLRFEGAAASAKGKGASGKVAIEIVAEGQADTLLQWLYALESGELVLRFNRAELESDGQPASSARLTGEIAAIWVAGR